jgi:hypothetical protein
MDFKAQILKDLIVFHNPGEFATMTRIWYRDICYTIPVIIDHETTKDRKTLVNDHAEGINFAEALVYISFNDLGVMPKKGHYIEIEEAGVIQEYEIINVNYEDGEIVLEVGVFTE